MLHINDDWVEILPPSGYEISVEGKVRLYDKYKADYDPILPTELLNDVAVVRLRNHDTFRKYPHILDELMLEAFIEEPRNVNLYNLIHIDGDPLNCRLDNYGWQRKFIPEIKTGEFDV